MSLLHVSSQTAGPYLAIGFVWCAGGRIDGGGEPVQIEGRVFDGDGVAIDDAAVEVWQADADGRYATDPRAFRGFARVLTQRDGAFRLTTFKPGRVAGNSATLQAPHLAVTLFMRGSLRHLHSRIYFPDEAANADDPVLAQVAPARRATLIARRIDGDATRLAWDIHLQGVQETVFFEF